MLSWVALHLAVAISALDGDESSRRELDINYSNQCKNLATKYGKKQRKRMKKYDRMHCPLEWLEDHCPVPPPPPPPPPPPSRASTAPPARSRARRAAPTPHPARPAPPLR
jgi:hypothetical protein